jgi:protein-disulfide isomerase
MSNEIKAFIIAAVVFIGLGVLLFVFGNPQPKPEGVTLDPNSLVRSTSHMTGATTAKVTLVEFGDFQCPACKNYAPVIKELKEKYKDNPDFNFVFRNFPLSQHKNAKAASAAAEAAGEQGKYWEMYDMLYARQSEWENLQDPIPAFVSYAGLLGINSSEVEKAIKEDRFTQIINTDIDDGLKVKVSATPSFFLNGQPVPGLQPKTEAFVGVIEQALSQPTPTASSTTQTLPQLPDQTSTTPTQTQTSSTTQN